MFIKFFITLLYYCIRYIYKKCSFRFLTAIRFKIVQLTDQSKAKILYNFSK